MLPTVVEVTIYTYERLTNFFKNIAMFGFCSAFFLLSSI